MTLDLVTLILIYPLVFLAVVFLAWLAWSFSQKQRQQRDRLLIACSCCGAWVNCDGATVWVRCPACGHRNELAGVPRVAGSAIRKAGKSKK
jgi:DNA-directed RNA polymerase subunit RPC12/RpoP